MKKFIFRLSGVSVSEAINEITLDLSKSRSELLSEIKSNYGLRTDTQLKLVADGKMRDIAQIVQMPYLSKPISMMMVQEGAGSFTVEQYNLLTDIYYILNPDSQGQEIDIQQINDLLVEFDVDKRLVRNLFNFPKDINPIIELQSQFQNEINDENIISKIQNTFNDFIIENELIDSQDLDEENNVEKITLWIEDSITGEIQEIEIEKDHNIGDIVQIVREIIPNIAKKPVYKKGAVPITILVNGMKFAQTTQLQDILNKIKLPNNQRINVRAIVLRERTTSEKLEIRNRLVNDLMKRLNLNEDQMKLLKSDIFDEVRTLKLDNKKLIKENLYETLINYYIEKELWFIDYARYVERIGKEIRLTKTEIDKYAPGWNVKDVQLIQRLCWAIIFDHRHPMTGTKMTLSQWLSFPLHHWMTESGHENKYICLLSAVLPFPADSRIKFGYPYHKTISNDVNYKNKGLKWQNDIEDVLSSIILKGEAPDTWIDKNQEDFNSYLESELDENTRKFIISLLFISYI